MSSSVLNEEPTLEEEDYLDLLIDYSDLGESEQLLEKWTSTHKVVTNNIQQK